MIATAKVYGYTVISFEKLRLFNGGQPMSKPKIPNLCLDLNVNYTDLFNMMEVLGIKL
ncbi:DUF4411 family protein [Virgibacillus sp. NKC19-3]|uniref:DUF4411 family protein n=1 Tax=Virgibacillus saliphilus TaxID=2831674 RepID=UPI001C9B3422|nr:DUF4411 family protein [Virgibacillus sp. NKC19-3]